MEVISTHKHMKPYHQSLVTSDTIMIKTITVYTAVKRDHLYIKQTATSNLNYTSDYGIREGLGIIFSICFVMHEYW